MTDLVVHDLEAATLASTLAVLLVALLRKLVRRYSGPQTAYLLWLMVPVITLAVFIPEAPMMRGAATVLSGAQTVSTYLQTLSTDHQPRSAGQWLLMVWLAGIVLTAGLNITRQMRFARRLSGARRDDEGVVYSDQVTGPMLVGTWRQWIVVPSDFNVRHAAEERSLMLAHERSHQERGDAYVIALATAWLCLFWFNPLMYWARGRLRFDQELACDALVISKRPSTRRLYASVLLAAQLPDVPAWDVPTACHWTSAHPLKERIKMLKQIRPGSGRRATGVVAILCLSLLGVFTVMSASHGAPAAASSSPDTSLSQKISIKLTDSDLRTTLETIARISDRNIVISPDFRGSDLDQRITLDFQDIELRACLDVITKILGATHRESNGVIYIEKLG